MAREAHPEDEAQIEEGVEFSMLSIATNSAMGALKFAVGLVYGSPALMAGALYSINDVLSSVAVNVSLRLAGRGPSRDFPWGYEKAEFLATGLTGVILGMAVTGVFIYQFDDLTSSDIAPPHITTLGVALLSIVVSGYMWRRAADHSQRLRSPALHTTSEHSKADAISSVAVVVGIGAAAIGWHVVDRLVAVFEIGHIVFLAGELVGAGMIGLMDRGLPSEDVEMIRDACGELVGVEGVIIVRSRRGTRSCWVDVVVGVPGGMKVQDTDALAERVAQAIRLVVGESTDSRVKFQPV